MIAKQRSVLLVEDRPDFQVLLKMACKNASSSLEEALKRIYANLPSDTVLAHESSHAIVNIFVASTESEAQHYLENLAKEHIALDFVSVDLALDEDEYDQSDSDAQASVGGMRILEELTSWARQPLAVVVSGEKAQSYPIIATLTYKVFGYLPKHVFDIKDYSRLITSACLYQEARDIITAVSDGMCDPDYLEIARAC